MRLRVIALITAVCGLIDGAIDVSSVACAWHFQLFMVDIIDIRYLMQ